jgi:hypothetical protein
MRTCGQTELGHFNENHQTQASNFHMRHVTFNQTPHQSTHESLETLSSRYLKKRTNNICKRDVIKIHLTS